MATKTFKIGEYAVGGIIRATVAKKAVKIQALDWTTKQVVSERSFTHDFSLSKWDIESYLNDLTSCYYADKVLNWIFPQPSR
jgi:hypothetical protein